MRGGKENVENWGSNSYITYFLLADNADPETVKSKLNDLYTNYTKSTPQLFEMNWFRNLSTKYTLTEKQTLNLAITAISGIYI